MPLAELHGKLPDALRRSEDVLTSSAFGLLTLLPPTVFLRWLGGAIRADGTRLALDPAATISATFWPQVVERSGGTCEPDVLLTIEGDLEVVGVLVEVKYRSDMSGWPSPVEDPEVRSQLGREWVVLRDLGLERFPGAPRKIDRRVLIYVTVDPVLPRTTFDVVAGELAGKGHNAADFLVDAYWLSWFDLHRIVSAALAEPGARPEVAVGLARLEALLLARRLCAFGGIERPHWDGHIKWSYDARRPYATACPVGSTKLEWTYSETQR